MRQVLFYTLAFLLSPPGFAEEDVEQPPTIEHLCAAATEIIMGTCLAPMTKEFLSREVLTTPAMEQAEELCRKLGGIFVSKEDTEDPPFEIFYCAIPIRVANIRFALQKLQLLLLERRRKI